MRFSIIHISDIHFQTNKESNYILEKTSNLINSVGNKLKYIDRLFIIITGDIANTGISCEYNIAREFLEILKSGLQKYHTKLSIEFIIAPGNHDCNFSNSNPTRNLIIDNIVKENINIKTIENEFIETLTSVQKDFFSFRNELHNKEAVVEELNNNLFIRYEFKLLDITLSFNIYNFAWVSLKNEKQSELYYPCIRIKDKLQERTKIDKSFNISIYHHPLHWVNHKNIRNLRELINSTSNVVLSGHEHTSAIHNEHDYDTGTTQYIDSSALQTKNLDESSFKYIEFDLKNEEQLIYELIWDKSIGSYKETINNNSLAIEISSSLYELKDEYFNKINATGAQISHTYKSDISLEDLFVYQRLQVLTQDDTKLKFMSSELKNITKLEKTIVFGAETSGKSSLAYMLQIHYKRNRRIPIYLSGKNIKKKDIDEKKIISMINKSFQRQYLDNLYENYKKEDFENIVLIIDDFNDCELNNSFKSEFLNKLNQLYKNIIIFAHESLELEAFNDREMAHSLSEYNSYKIMEFGHELRDKLIKRWVTLGREDIITNEEIHTEVIKKSKILTSTIGSNIVPSYPIYLLTLLQAIEGSNASPLTDSSYGHYYRYLINESFIKNGINAKQWELYYTYLSELAYGCLKTNIYNLDINDLQDFHEKYRKEHRIGDSFETIKNNLLKTKVLQEDVDTYKFTYDYLYYFFVAKYLADNLHIPEVRETIEKLVKNSYRIEFGNIIMFLIHHSNKEYIIKLLLVQTKSIFNEIEEFRFEKEELIKINGSLSGKHTLIVENKSLQETRDTYLKQKEEEEENTIKNDREQANLEDNISISELDLFSKLNLAFKLTNILGEVAKNYYGSLQGNIKIELIKESYSLNLRAINVFISNFEEHYDLIVEAVDNLIEKKGYNTQDKIANSSKAVVFNILTKLTEGFISKLSKSVASKDLYPIYKDVLNNNKKNEAIKMINAAIDLDFPTGLNQNKIIQHYTELEKNYLAQAVLKRLVVEHLYMFPIKHNLKDSIMAKLDIEKSANKNILAKQGVKNSILR